MRKERSGKMRKLLPAMLAVILAAVMIVPVGGLARGSESAGKLTLEVKAGSQDVLTDLESAKMRVDLYQIATGEKDTKYDTWHWTLTEDYMSLADGNRPIDENGTIIDESVSNESFAELANAAAKLAITSDKILPASQSIECSEGTAVFDPVLSGEGLYVIVPREADIDDDSDIITEGDLFQTEINTKEKSYQYSPSIVALPGKDAIDGSIGTAAEYGSWKNDVTVVLKPNVSDRKGQIKIIKNLLRYETKNPVSFVFSVKATLGGEPVYSDVVSMSFGDDSQDPSVRTYQKSDERIIKDLPIGATVEVKEIYPDPNDPNAYYKLVSSAVSDDSAVVTADKTLEFTFTNDYNDRYHGGGGAENQYVYIDEGENPHWTTHQVINGQDITNSEGQGEAEQ